jgi:acetyltransferase
VADHPQIEELDINPLWATPAGVLALDARVITSKPAAAAAGRPFAHLAIRPYPDEWERPATLANGKSIFIRPLRPEDEPAWHALLRSCSPETLWSRFRHVFKETTHEMAARFCFIDYDREMALAGEYESGGAKGLAGIGRLVCDSDRKTAELAILVADAWQGQGLGSRLTDACLDVAREWGVRQVVAEMTSGNSRMLATFRRRGFELRTQGDVVLCTKELSAEP